MLETFIMSLTKQKPEALLLAPASSVYSPYSDRMVLKIHNGKLSLAENFFRPEDSNFEYLYWAEPACDFVIGRFHCIIERMIILSL